MDTWEKPSVFADSFALGNGQMVQVKFVPEEIAPSYYKILKQLIDSEKHKDTDPDTYSKALIQLMVLLFGKGTKLVLEYYAGDYVPMVNRFVLYIGTKIAPVMRQASKDRKRRAKADAKAMRAAARVRWFGWLRH